MGDGGAAPMEVEMGEDNAHKPTGELLTAIGRPGQRGPGRLRGS